MNLEDKSMLSEVLRRARLVAALGLVACVVCTPAPASPLHAGAGVSTAPVV